MIKLENKTLLPKPFGGMNWHRLPEYIKRVMQDVQSLQILNTAVGRTKRYSTNVIAGTPLIIGNRYRVSLVGGDNFSNVGYVSNNVYFIATATTPTTWTTSNVRASTVIIDIIYNDIDSALEIVPINALESEFKITNSLFNPLKTYPQIQSVSSFNIVDNNTIKVGISEGFDVSTDFTYFKIEVYN